MTLQASLAPCCKWSSSVALTLLLLLQTIDVLMLLETPYPRNETVVVLSQTAQLVDDDMRPVPLSEVRPSISAAT